jgi:hypothetical protein
LVFTLIIINDDVAYKRIINYTDVVELRNIGTYLYKIRCGFENKISKRFIIRNWEGESIIALMMEAVITSETSVNVYQTTWRNIPEDSHHQFSKHNASYRTSWSSG